MTFEPLKDRIAVKLDELQDIIRDSGLIITKEAQEKPQQGTVMAIGPEVRNIKVGDRVLFQKFEGQEHIVEGVKVSIMREDKIWGVYD